MSCQYGKPTHYLFFHVHEKLLVGASLILNDASMQQFECEYLARTVCLFVFDY